MMVTTRLWLGGEVSERRDMPLIRRLIERVRRCAALAPAVVVYRWLGVYIARCGRPFVIQSHGEGRTSPAASVAQRLHRPGREALRAAAGGRDRTPHCGWHAGTRGDAPTSVTRRRSDQHSVHRATERDVSGTPRSLTRRCRALARCTLTLHEGMSWWARSIIFVRRIRVCLMRKDDASDGGGDHGSLLEGARPAVVSRAAASLGTPEATWASFAGDETPDGAVVCVTTVKCGATRYAQVATNDDFYYNYKCHEAPPRGQRGWRPWPCES